MGFHQTQDFEYKIFQKKMFRKSQGEKKSEYFLVLISFFMEV